MNRLFAGMMALISPHSGVDTVHAMKVALVHDLAEAIVGDITPDDPMTKEEKFQRGESVQ